MDFVKSLAIAAAGLRAQAGRMRVISENIANADSTSPQAGGDPLYVASCTANEHFAEQARRTVSLWRPLANEPVR